MKDMGESKISLVCGTTFFLKCRTVKEGAGPWASQQWCKLIMLGAGHDTCWHKNEQDFSWEQNSFRVIPYSLDSTHTLWKSSGSSGTAGLFCRTLNAKCRMLNNSKFSDGVRKVIELDSILGHLTGKTDLKLNSPSFLTLITNFQSHSMFCIRQTPNAERRMTLKFSD